MPGEHRHEDYEGRMDALQEQVDAQQEQLATLAGGYEELEARVIALENAEPEPPEPPEPGPEPEPPKLDVLWQSDYTTTPWWENNGVVGVALPQSHDMATKVITDPFGKFNQVIQADCLVNTVLDSQGTTYGFTDRCSFAEMGMCDTDAQGITEFYCAQYVAVPANWGESEPDERWRTQSGSCKMPNTFGSYDPARGSGSQPYSNNFAALAWAANLGCVLRGPPGATDYDRDRNRPSTFFSVAQAGGQQRQPTPNGTKMNMIMFYWHLNPNPRDLLTGAGQGTKPWVFFERGKWHKIETYVRTNTAGQANGEYKGWFDGDLGMHITDLKLGPNWARGINVLHFQYFHGGPYGLDTSQRMFLGPMAFDHERLML